LPVAHAPLHARCALLKCRAAAAAFAPHCTHCALRTVVPRTCAYVLPLLRCCVQDVTFCARRAPTGSFSLRCLLYRTALRSACTYLCYTYHCARVSTLHRTTTLVAVLPRCLHTPLEHLAAPMHWLVPYSVAHTCPCVFPLHTFAELPHCLPHLLQLPSPPLFPLPVCSTLPPASLGSASPYVTLARVH